MNIVKSFEIYNDKRINELKNALIDNQFALVRTDLKDFIIYQGKYGIGNIFNSPLSIVNNHKTTLKDIKMAFNKSKSAKVIIYEL